MTHHVAGIEAIGLAVPETFIEMTELAEARGVAPGKYLEGLGVSQMAVPMLDEDTVTLAVRAGIAALESSGTSPDDIGLCIVGTETAVDHSKPVASYVQGLLRLPRHCRVYETKHACYGGTAGLQTALDWVRAGSARGKKALIICSDIARYGLRSAGEPTQGAGAVALLVSDQPHLVAMDFGAVGTCSNDVMDFWRPLYSKNAVVDGHYSVECYLDALKGAYGAHLALTERPRGSSARFSAICYHVPYPKMAKKAHQALCEVDGRDDFATSYETQVGSGLVLPRKVGNIYTGSLYLSLASVLTADARSLDGAPVAFMSYGSGSCAEFWSGTVTAGAQQRLKALGVDGLLARRRRLSLGEYEEVMHAREELDSKPLTAPGQPFRFLGVENDRRRYSTA